MFVRDRFRMKESIDARIARAASTSHGMVSARTLREHGVGRSSIQRRVADGRLVLIMPRVYSVACPAQALSPDARAVATLMCAGEGSALSHTCAGGRHRIWVRAGSTIHVTTPHHRYRRTELDVVFHESWSLSPDEIVLVGGLSTTSVARTILDLGTCLTEYQLANVLGEASFLGLLRLAELEARLANRVGRRGSRIVRRSIELHRAGSAGTRSWSEDRVLGAWRRLDIDEPLVNVRGAAGIIGNEPDFVWPDRLLIVEVDGPGHDRPQAADQDARRDDLLRRSGWTVLRFSTAHVWNDLPSVVHTIREHHRR